MRIVNKKTKVFLTSMKKIPTYFTLIKKLPISSKIMKQMIRSLMDGSGDNFRIKISRESKSGSVDFHSSLCFTPKHLVKK